MIPVEEAFEKVLSTRPGFGSEEVALEQACGRILRQKVVAERDFPPFDRVCMDGIAIDYRRYATGTRRFYRQYVLPAGEAPQEPAAPGACVEVMTGAVLPQGTGTVVPYEHLEESRENGKVWYAVKEQVAEGQHIHVRGSDAPAGAALLEAGCRITPPAVAVMASSGISLVTVSRMPEVCIISSGDELVAVSANPLPYQLRQSNTYALQALLLQHGIKSRLYHVRDDPGEITALLRQLRSEEADCIITTGGVSAGKKDYIPSIAANEGAEILFHKVAQRPGKPLLFGKWKNGPVLFGLPGNPVSSMASCCRYVLPWIREGLKAEPLAPFYAKLGEEVKIEVPLTCFLPVSLRCSAGAEFVATPLRGKGSGDFISMKYAAAFLELPPGGNVFRKGDVYRVWPIGPV